MVLGEVCSYVTCGTVAVVGSSLNDNCDTCGAVALVNYLFVVLTGRAESLLDSSLDIIVRNVVGFCLKDKVTKLGVGSGISAALLNCDGNFLTYLCEDFSSLRVGLFLLVLDIRPFAVSGHNFYLSISNQF